MDNISCATTVQGLGTTLAFSVGLIILEQVIAASECKSNSTVQLLLNMLKGMRPGAAAQPLAPYPTPPSPGGTI